ncbi:MAG: EAL domain-containing protein [Ruminiclostridium sp.]
MAKNAKNTAKKSIFSSSAIFSAVISAVLIIAVIATTAIYSVVSRKSVENTSLGIALAATKGTGNSADTYFITRRIALESYALRFHDALEMDDERVVVILRECVQKGIFRNIGFTRSDGVCVNDLGMQKNVSHRGFTQSGLEGKESIVPDTVSDFSGLDSDIYTVPVRDENGEIIGVLSAAAEPFSMNKITVVDMGGVNNCYFLVADDGDIIYASDNPAINLSKSDNLLDVASESDRNRFNYWLSRSNVSDNEVIKINGTDCVVSCVSLAAGNWSLISIVPADTITSAYGGLINLTVSLIIAVVIILIVVTVFLTLNLARVNRRVTGIIDEADKNFYVDRITGFSSWNSFKEQYEVMMKNTGSSYAFISVDIDNFKAINDSLGYDGGNEILKQLADILKRNIKDTDIFARTSGDLFYILAEYQNANELIDIANNIITDVDYQITSFKMYVSIGIYLIIDHRLKVRAAADRSDLARSTIKNIKESKFAFFDNSMIQKIRLERSIENIMEDALEKREFIVYLQPKVNLNDPDTVAGAEALVRWNHDGSIVPPGDFIPIFEKNGFVMKLDYYMFEEVCKLQKKWKSLGCEPKIISVNMSRLHLRNKTFVEDLEAMCQKYEIETKYFELEITESAAYENIDILAAVFAKIKEHGFHVSIDDFGTGYSSLNMLKDLPVDVLKIDRSFLTEGADENENASRIIGCVVSLASSLNISTICEGIETKEQAALLHKLGCNMAQGFYFARPMPVEDYEKLTYGTVER